jgi:Rrf2 family protein
VLRLSKKADYGLMAVQYMASVQYGDLAHARVVNTKEIAQEYNIPVELLAKVLQTLAKHGIVESQNGPKGGYVLARNAKAITIAQVLEAIEGPLGITDCYHDGASPCLQQEHCNIRTPLLKVQSSIQQLLNSMTVEDMMGGTPLITVQSVQPMSTAEGAER